MFILTKNDKSIYCVKFSPKVTPVIWHSIANFLMQCLGMPSERFLVWTRKRSPTHKCFRFETFVCSASPRDQHRNWCVASLLSRPPVRFNHGIQRFRRAFWVGNICIIDENSYLINKRYWSRLGIFRKKNLSHKFVYERGGGHRSKHVLASRP